MTDRAAFDLARYREMGIDELARFIADSLEQRYDPDPGSERPHLQEEFMSLWKLLREKVDAMPDDPPPPPDPLQAAYSKRARTKARLDQSPGDPSIKKRHITLMRHTLNRLEREIREMEASSEYARYRSPTPAPETAKQASKRTASKLFQAIESAFTRQPTGRFQWRPLPPDQATPQRVHGYYRERLQHEGRIDRLNQDRLATATALPYKEWWVPTEGFGGFDAYSIISFDHTNKVLLECPIYGNAAYVIDAPEEVWREMTKQQLTESGLAVRIPHQGANWPAKVRQALDIAETA